MKKDNKQNKKQKIDKSQLFVRIMAIILAVMMASSVFISLIFAIIYG